ncbi:MAG: hypothetical protein AVDCRST_MAG16-66, partial [uncultured Frankineae bacterium]
DVGPPPPRGAGRPAPRRGPGPRRSGRLRARDRRCAAGGGAVPARSRGRADLDGAAGLPAPGRAGHRPRRAAARGAGPAQELL